MSSTMKLPELLKFRANVIATIRGFFHDRGYTEVDTPVALLAPPPEVHIDPIAASIVLYVLTVYISSGLFATSIRNDESLQRSKDSLTSVDASAEIQKSTTWHCDELKELTTCFKRWYKAHNEEYIAEIEALNSDNKSKKKKKAPKKKASKKKPSKKLKAKSKN